MEALPKREFLWDRDVHAESVGNDRVAQRRKLVN